MERILDRVELVGKQDLINIINIVVSCKINLPDVFNVDSIYEDL